MIQPLPDIYNAMVRAGEITQDAAQRDIMEALEELRLQLAQQSENESMLSRLFKKAPEPQRGIYIWGNVGRGKSMLMDLFFNNTPVTGKRRVHFHAFMQEVHNRIHELRQSGQRGRSGADPVAVLAKQLAEETPLLCFDELQATDVADATLLYRLFQGLFDAGVVIVSTSNREPANLYTGGIQAERFSKFIELIDENMDVLSLDSHSDYRLLQRKSLQHVYHTPLGDSAQRFIEDTLSHIARGKKQHTARLTVKGRELVFTAYASDIACFSFHTLCEQPLGAADYLAIVEHYDTLILTDIPRLSAEKRNEAKRFVTLVDTLYENGTRLICTAAAAPAELYNEGDGSFEFQRTVSRLMEMQSNRYLQSEKPVASA
jgi:cell division protein ZapE